MSLTEGGSTPVKPHPERMAPLRDKPASNQVKNIAGFRIRINFFWVQIQRFKIQGYVHHQGLLNPTTFRQISTDATVPLKIVNFRLKRSFNLMFILANLEEFSGVL